MCQRRQCKQDSMLVVTNTNGLKSPRQEKIITLLIASRDYGASLLLCIFTMHTVCTLLSRGTPERPISGLFYNSRGFEPQNCGVLPHNFICLPVK